MITYSPFKISIGNSEMNFINRTIRNTGLSFSIEKFVKDGILESCSDVQVDTGNVVIVIQSIIFRFKFCPVCDCIISQRRNKFCSVSCRTAFHNLKYSGIISEDV